GQAELQTGSRLRFDASNPSRDLLLLPGAQLTGPGTLKLEGNCRLAISEDTTLSGGLQMDGGTAVVGSGTFSLAGTKSLAGTFSVPVNVLSGAVSDFSGGATFNNNLSVLAGGTMTVLTSASINLNAALTNNGTLKLVSACNRVVLQGSGRIENLGQCEFFQDSACNNGTESIVAVPINVPVGGKLLLSTNAQLNLTAGSSLTLVGQAELQTGSRLRFDASNPSRDLLLLPGAQLTGPGTLKLEGNCRLAISEDTTLSGGLQMDGGTAVVGSGTFSLAGTKSLAGTFSVPVNVLNAAVIDFSGGATFNNNLSILAGGTMTVLTSASINLNAALTNNGTIKLVSGCNRVVLQGSGHVENRGLWEIFQDSACINGTETIVFVPVNVPSGGQLLLSSNAPVNFSAPSSLNVAGRLEIQGGARLRLDGSNPARDLTLAAGSTLVGFGKIQLEGFCRLLVPGDLDSTVQIVLNSSSAQLVVPGTYVIRTPQSMFGVIQAGAVVVSTNSALTLINDSSFAGPIDLQSGAQL